MIPLNKSGISHCTLRVNLCLVSCTAVVLVYRILTCHVIVGKSVPLQKRGAQRVPELKVPRLRDNGPGWR